MPHPMPGLIFDYSKLAKEYPKRNGRRMANLDASYNFQSRLNLPNALASKLQVRPSAPKASLYHFDGFPIE